MRWKPYPAYKESGVEWVGEVPEHWRTLRLKHASSINDEALPETTDPDYEIEYVDIGGVDPNRGVQEKQTMRFENAPSRARRCVRHGDVIVSTVRTGLRAIAPVRNPELNLIVSTGFAIVRPKCGLECDFAAYVLRAPYFVDAVVARSVGVSYPAINASEIGTLRIGLPPEDEQHAISAFLDRETARIDGLIAKKERQIELLQEKRGALVSHAVTKGLNPDVKMKPSGVEWVGEVPEHWRTQKLKFISSTAFSSVDKHRTDGEVPVRLCNYVDVYYHDYITESINFMEATATPEEVAKFRLHKGDVLVTKDSEEWDDIAVPAYVASDLASVLCGYHLAQIRAKKGVLDGKYLFRSFDARGINDQFRVAATGITRFGLGKDSLDNGLFLVPPVEEQRAISAFLDRGTARIDGLIETIKTSIALLREYRTALISAAVTGKIDVRGN